MSLETCQLISYIAPAAPATRRPATGQSAVGGFLRPEISFTPNWYRPALGIDFGRRWHTDPEYRCETVVAMRSELKRRFGGIDRPDKALDLLTGTYGCIGIYNCAWNADPYIGDYATVPHLGYIDMGLDSDLARAREAIASARRAVMYTPMDLANKSLETIRADIERVARDYAPCDVVVADIEAGTPDERVLAFLELCNEINCRMENL